MCPITMCPITITLIILYLLYCVLLVFLASVAGGWVALQELVFVCLRIVPLAAVFSFFSIVRSSTMVLRSAVKTGSEASIALLVYSFDLVQFFVCKFVPFLALKLATDTLFALFTDDDIIIFRAAAEVAFSLIMESNDDDNGDDDDDGVSSTLDTIAFDVSSYLHVVTPLSNDEKAEYFSMNKKAKSTLSSPRRPPSIPKSPGKLPCPPPPIRLEERFVCCCRICQGKDSAPALNLEVQDEAEDDDDSLCFSVDDDDDDDNESSLDTLDSGVASYLEHLLQKTSPKPHQSAPRPRITIISVPVPVPTPAPISVPMSVPAPAPLVPLMKSVTWNPQGNLGYEYQKEAPSGTRGTEFRNVGFRGVRPRQAQAPAPAAHPAPPGAPIKLIRVGGVLIDLVATRLFDGRLDYSNKKKRQISNGCEERPRKRVRLVKLEEVRLVVEEPPTINSTDDDDDDDDDTEELTGHSTDGDDDGDPVMIAVERPLRRSARIAAKNKPLPRSAPIAASGVRRSARLATKARVSYAL
jgi:hypothetical protein